MNKSKQKIMLVWAANADELSILMSALRSTHEIVYWVGSRGRDGSTGVTDIPFHEHYAAWAGAPAEGFIIEEFPLPTSELLASLTDTESLTLTMMDKHFDPWPVDQRKHLYYIMVRYWHGILLRYRPDWIIFPTVPHTVYNFIIYRLAKIMGIQTLMFEDSWVSDRLLMYADYIEGSRELHQCLLAHRGENFTVTDLSPDIRNYYELQTNPKRDATPIYMQHWYKRFAPLNVFKEKLKLIPPALCNGTLLRRAWNFVIRLRRPNLKKEYESVQGVFDFNEKFVYVPLSFQPERTTSPQGGIFVDQLLMIETLSAALPPGWKIYVKEHPSQWMLRSGVEYSSARYPNYYRRLAAIPHVTIVPIRTDTFVLSRASRAVAVVTGTAGWEAILRGKPVLCFGYPWYRDFEGLFRVDSYESVQAAFERILRGFAPGAQSVINYLKCVDISTTHGYIESFVNKQSRLSSIENMHGLVERIYGVLDK